MTRRRELGSTMAELMVAMLLVAVTSAFAFGIYARSAASFRAQSRVSEAQQTLRSAAYILTRDLRQAGNLVLTFRTNLDGAGTTNYGALSITDGGSGPDQIRILYADQSAFAHVKSGTTFSTGVVSVDSTTGFAVGNIVVAAVTVLPMVGQLPDYNGRGDGCLLKVTGVVAGTSLQVASSGTPYNSALNAHCVDVQAAAAFYTLHVNRAPESITGNSGCF